MASQEMIDRFLADPEAKLPPKKREKANRGSEPKPDSNRKARARLKAQSHRQALREANWAGMKAMALYLLGVDAVCGICEQPLHDGQVIDADHIDGRVGEHMWTPENLQLCHRSCHEDKTGTVQWSEVAS